MSLGIVSNFAASVAHRNLTANDVAALAIGSRLSAEVAGLNQASINAGQATSMLQIAEGALGRIGDIVMRMRSLAVQSASEQVSNTERAYLNTEYLALKSEIDRIAADTEFNGQALLGGGTKVRVVGIGANIEVNDGIIGIKFGNASNVPTGGKVFRVAYNSVVDKFAVTTGTKIQFSEKMAAAPATGQTTDVYFSEFDLTLTIGSNFNAGANILVGNLFTAATVTAPSLTYSFKVGSGAEKAVDDLSITLGDVTTGSLATATGTNFDTSNVRSIGTANEAMDSTGAVIKKIASYRASIAADQNRLEFASANLSIATENMEAARSELLDLDVAAEMSQYVSAKILVESGVAMMAQANVMPRHLLQLYQ